MLDAGDDVAREPREITVEEERTDDEDARDHEESAEQNFLYPTRVLERKGKRPREVEGGCRRPQRWRRGWWRRRQCRVESVGHLGRVYIHSWEEIGGTATSTLRTPDWTTNCTISKRRSTSSAPRSMRGAAESAPPSSSPSSS